MAHFAEINENNIVLRVLVIGDDDCKDQDGNESEVIGALFCHKLFGGRWKQTSYNARIRKNYAGIGYAFDAARDAFIAPQPLPSWVLNETTCQWEPPIAYPTDGKMYTWDEQQLNWIENP